MDEDTEHKDVDDEINRLLREAEALELIFNEPTNLLKELKDSYGRKNYASILENSAKVLVLMDEPTEKFIKIGMAFSISAAADWITTLKETGVDISEAQNLISKAREQFAGGDFRMADETIGEVRKMFLKLEEEQAKSTEEGIAAAEQLIEEARKIDAEVYAAERALSQAKNAQEAENFPETARLVKEAKEEAEKAKELRIQTISDALLFTGSVIDESMEVGVDTSESDTLYEEAKSAFDEGDFKRSAELNKEAEEKALQLQDEHIKKVMALKEKRASMMEKKVSETKPEAPPGYEAPSEEAREDACPNCGSKMRFIEKYSRFWCNSCQKYAPKR